MIQIVAYDPGWPAEFERLSRRLWPALADLALAIEHVGSTAVPGLWAKPIIDLTIVVRQARVIATVIDRLAPLGYEHCGDLGIVGREAFAAPPDRIEHHLYACVDGALPLRNHLAVRDRLRGDPALARAYGDLKRRLALQHAHDRDAYTAGKSEFLAAVLRDAGLSEDQVQSIRRANQAPPR